MSGFGRRVTLPRLALCLVIGAAGFLISYLVGAGDRILALAQSVTAVVVVAASVVLWLWRRDAGTAVDATVASRAATVADELAAVIKGQWEKAAVERRLRFPAPMPTRWHWSQRPVAGPIEEAVHDGKKAARLAPLPGVPRVGQRALHCGEARDLFGIYGGLDSGRLIILGLPGAGKSAVAILLLLDALTHRQSLADSDRSRVPVPVLVTLSGWDPRSQHVVDWLAQQLTFDYPFLVSGRHGDATVRRLIRDGLIAPFFDGLDELPKPLRPVAVEALNTQITLRLVLLSRSVELVDAVAGGPLDAAAAIELEPVAGGDAAAYLARCHTQPLAAPWQRLVDHLRDHRDSPITQALDTPLMVTLVRDTFPDAAEIDDVLRPGRYQMRHEVEDTLLDRVLPAAYRRIPSGPDPPCTLEQAQRWLGYLAARMNQDITRDLTWWRMARWTPIMFRVVATAILPVPCLGLVLGLVSGPIIGVAAALVLSALIFAIGLAFRHTSRRPQQLGRIRWEGVVRGRNLALGLFAGLAFGLAFGLTLGPTTGVAVGFAIGMSTWLQMGLAMTTRRSSADDDEPLDPLTCWRRDRRFWLVFGMMVGLAVGLAVGFTVDLPTGLAFGFMSALGFGILSGSTWPATLTFIHLWRAGVAPLRMLRFLEDARRRQVLRTVGPLYQFRHARLQDRLAADFLRPHHHAPANDRPGDRQPVA